MSRHARIEEIDDDNTVSRITEINDDDDEFDDDMDFDLPELPSTVPQASSQSTNDAVNPQGIKYVQDTKQFKSWTCLYPIYFDANKTTKQGRRVGIDRAVKNPLAKAIADAGKTIGFSVVFEPQKCHPADWSNPGRVRIQFKENGTPTHPRIKTKGQLNEAIATYLRANPTRASDPQKVPVPGMEAEKSSRAAIPKGMRVNDILPLHSPAMAGGGMAAEGMANMMGSMFPGMQGMLDPEPAANEAGPSQPPQVTGPPKKPKMKRQIIR